MGKKQNSARFPVARIKKLIQADEDVGKVAQGTPIVVSKALELFLAELVGECVKQAESRGTKKITAYGLKSTILSVPTFDFCTDIVSSIPDPIEEPEPAPSRASNKRKKSSAKVESEDEDAAEDDDDDPYEYDVKPKRGVKRGAPKPRGESAAAVSGNGKAKEVEAPIPKQEEEEEDEDEEDGYY